MRKIALRATASSFALMTAVVAAQAQQATTSDATAPVAVDTAAGVFELGQINVVSPAASEYWDSSGAAISETNISNQEMFTFNRNRLDDALTLAPGVAVSSGGARNEPTVSVRGFNLWQVPVSIDGVRVYLPYDNRLDISRFVTPDLSEVQVQEGYVSILNGPGGMGGAINLVTRKPTRAVEGEVRAGVGLGNTGAYTDFNSTFALGSKQEGYYVQASGAFNDSDGFFLPSGFTPLNPWAEDGGRRDHSESQDWRVNLKVGFTPNDTDEYTLNYTVQQGEKGTPYDIWHNVRTPDGWKGWADANQTRNWTWPEWNWQTAYFLSKTAIGTDTYLNTRFYYTWFDNTLAAYDNTAFDTQYIRGFNSFYNDQSFGTDLELVHEINSQDTIKGVFTYRRDSHASQDENNPGLGTTVWDPTIKQSEAVLSFGVENTVHFTKNFDFVAGVSYNYRDLLLAEDYGSVNGNGDVLYSHPLTTDDTIDWQFAGIYRYSDKGQINASVSSRTRFPTLFERFSSRFGSAIANPDLQAERATNYELAWRDTFNKTLALGASIFFNQVTNLIQSVDTDEWSVSNDTWITQNQNVGTSNNTGFILKAEWQTTDTLLLGGNYTYIHIDLSSPIEGIEATGTPEQYAFIYAKWKAWDNITLIPSATFSSSRWTNPSVGPLNYVRTDGYALANLSAEYQFNPQTTFSAGVQNIFDTEYETEWLYPQAGRNYFINGRVVF
ncbi:TonB-dependent receptor plug domain-containing protein [Xanthobacter agilis]|uniref:Iron complex outermembrane receptor protein n=1 Tax=Xanthobacter agilis TaxID=47492 RepID=A0ABU0LE31_XANAG|nr:TonB-dependent receptor [Xanthobacter agilis]MDQ0505407.1 iron complex outermembrane receptor protein [Xanthobacter agilis]